MPRRSVEESVGKEADGYRKRWREKYPLGPHQAMIGPPGHRARTHQCRGHYQRTQQADLSYKKSRIISIDCENILSACRHYYHIITDYNTRWSEPYANCQNSNKHTTRTRQIFIFFITAVIFIAINISPGRKIYY